VLVFQAIAGVSLERQWPHEVFVYSIGKYTRLHDEDSDYGVDNIVLDDVQELSLASGLVSLVSESKGRIKPVGML